MNRRGQVGWEQIMIGVLVIVMLIVVLNVVPRWITSPVQNFGTKFEFQTDFADCQRNFIPGSLDVDRDGCADYQDFCIDEKAKFESTRTTAQTLGPLGNNLCDRDSDNVPDACDIDPNDSKKFCTPDDQGKCPINTQKIPDYNHCERQVKEYLRRGTSIPFA